jgi:uncharacterized protein
MSRTGVSLLGELHPNARALALNLSFALVCGIGSFACDSDEMPASPTAAAGGGGASGGSARAGSGGAAGRPVRRSTGGAGAPALGGGGASGTDVADAMATMLSKPGKYKGYSEKLYTGYERSSVYVPARDMTELAVDIYRPKGDDGKVSEDKLPVVWMHTPFNRRYTATSADPKALTIENAPGAASKLLEYGYVVAIAEYRGINASFGKNVGYSRGEWVDAAKLDAYDITEWLAVQPWSNGNIGMWGCSAMGGSQLQAASTAPPHLKAIFPMSCEFDAYDAAVEGGVSPQQGTALIWPGESKPPEQRDTLAEPVDADMDKAKLMMAIAAHKDNVDDVGYAPFRDSAPEKIGAPWWSLSSPHTYLPMINASGIATYLAANWQEGPLRGGAVLAFNNLTVPTKLILGPGAHCDWGGVEKETGFDIAIEELRFFDKYLKGVENGIADEAKVHYYTYNTPAGSQWRSAMQWPLPNERRSTIYLLGNKIMSLVPPSGEATKDEIEVDYDVTPETISEKGLIYDQAAYSVDVEITGHPMVDLWVSSSAPDVDIVATLLDVGPDNTIAPYQSRGQMRASLRNVSDAPPYTTIKLPATQQGTPSLPYHPSNAADATPLTPGEPTRVTFALQPISMLVSKGHRLRIVLTFVAGESTPRLDPRPTFTLFRDSEHRSAISVPVITKGS